MPEREHARASLDLLGPAAITAHGMVGLLLMRLETPLGRAGCQGGGAGPAA